MTFSFLFITFQLFLLSYASTVPWLFTHLATKGPYIPPSHASIPFTPPPQCNLSQVHLIVRHGIRYPSADDIANFDYLKSILSEYLPWVRNWTNFNILDANHLALPGERSIYQLSRRVAKKYPTLFSNAKYTPTMFDFLASDAARSMQSGFVIGVGIFERENRTVAGAEIGLCSSIQSVWIRSIKKGEDTMLAMKHACQKWLKEVKNSQVRTEQEQIFMHTRLAPITHRLNAHFRNPTLFQPKDLEPLYKACAFEVSHRVQPLTWCSLFQPNEILTLEYANDLSDYYSYGNGHEINSLIACDLITSLLHEIENTSSQRKRATLKFGHAETILFLFNALGLARDSHPLLANATEDEIRNRKFRTSVLVPFGANVVFEVVKCLGTNDLKDEWKVRILLNETPVLVPGCEELFCTLEELKSIVGKKNGCNFEAICAFNDINNQLQPDYSNPRNHRVVFN